MDVLVHAIEAYVSIKSTDFTDALAEKAIKLIFENIAPIYMDVKNSDARDRVQNACLNLLFMLVRATNNLDC